MPRDGSNIYSQPFPDVVEDTTIESTVYNGFTNDVASDLNAARPIVAGGTGATSADQALFNLAAEKATQVVTNYDSHLWIPGSFRSAASATGAPTANAFAGVCYIAEALATPPTNANVVVEARDLDDASVPGKVYVREKKAGVWGAWTADLNAADVTTALSISVKVDADQSFTETQKAQGRENIYAAPFDALAYNGMQINGSMEVSQELGGGGRTTSGYVVDGFQVVFAGTMALTMLQIADGPTGIPNCLRIVVTTAQTSLAAGSVVRIQHAIEGFRTARLAFGTAAAQPISIGFWAKIHRIGTYSGSIVNSALNRSYPFTFTQNIADVWEYKTVTIPGDTTGTWVGATNGIGLYVFFAMASGSTFLATANTWGPGFMVGATGTTNGVAATSDTFQITGVVVLPGIEAPSAARSPLIMRPYDQELVTCRRYFEGGFEPTSGMSPFAAGTTLAYGERIFTTTKRAVPVVLLNNFQYFNTSLSVVACTANVTTTNVLQFAFNASGMTNWAGWAGVGTWTADARL